MYVLTLNGEPLGKPMTKLEAERKVNSLKNCVLGIGMRQVRAL